MKCSTSQWSLRAMEREETFNRADLEIGAPATWKPVTNMGQNEAVIILTRSS
jgi:hypothetical protein